MEKGQFKPEPGYSLWWEAEGELPSDEFLAGIKASGINYVETGIKRAWDDQTTMAFEERLEDVINSFKNAGIGVWSVHTPFGENIDISDPETAGLGIGITKRQMEVCAKNDVDKIVLHASTEPISDEDRKRRKECCIKSLDTLHMPDVAMAVETLPRTCLCNTAAETLEILNALGGRARCCVDVNHCQKEDVAQVIKVLSEHITTLHISDDDGIDERHWLPGDGILKWNEIIGAIEEIGYDGVFMYELRSELAQADKIVENYELLMRSYRAAK